MGDLHQDGWTIDEVYNFGMPRIGNSAFTQAFDNAFKGKFFRVTHGLDPFIDMPPSSGYTHVEPEVYYRGDVSEGYVICEVDGDKKCSAQHFPDSWGVAVSSRTAYHHECLG